MPQPWARMADANLNRAREGLRVMEDLARFGLDDDTLGATLKSIRHGLGEAADSLASEGGVDRGLRLAWRDTPGDVGRVVKTEAELVRAGAGAVVAAAAGRASEALRVLEECAKTLGAPRAAADFERLRYRLYDAERSLTLACGTGRARQWRLCVLISERLCAHHAWERVAERAIRGGADCLQLREKSLPDAELLRRAQRLAAIARAGGAASIINDRPDVALLAGADGVHAGPDDLPPDHVRRLAGSRLLVGATTDRLERARGAIRAGADYCGIGPIFASRTKPGVRPAGVEYLREYLGDPLGAQRPHLAIGGITPERVPELVRAGCRGVAVSGAVCGSPDPRGASEALLESIPPTQAPGP
ncbi:MAG: thiamine phosphate synthase [Phycisphaerae bacterium]|nr:thiamine phosphate synthase [Phycisphaerae bacterium]